MDDILTYAYSLLKSSRTTHIWSPLPSNYGWVVRLGFCCLCSSLVKAAWFLVRGCPYQLQHCISVFSGLKCAALWVNDIHFLLWHWLCVSLSRRWSVEIHQSVCAQWTFGSLHPFDFCNSNRVFSIALVWIFINVHLCIRYISACNRISTGSPLM